MDFKEKIIQYWLTFILTFLGFSKTLIIVPVFLQVDIYNEYFIGAINFIFIPAVYASDFLSKWFIFSSFYAGAPILLFNPIIAIVKLGLIAGESYILAWVVIFLLKRESTQDLLFRLFYIIKEKAEAVGGKILSRFGIKDGKYSIPALIIIFLIFGFGGYLFLGYSGQISTAPGKSDIGLKKISDLTNFLHTRDERRIDDLDFFGQALENYLRDNSQYPIAGETEKISEENSNIFQLLN